MKANEYRLLDRCVEDGIQLGINRAYKHLNYNEQPSISSLKENIQREVMLQISEWFEFSEQVEYNRKDERVYDDYEIPF